MEKFAESLRQQLGVFWNLGTQKLSSKEEDHKHQQNGYIDPTGERKRHDSYAFLRPKSRIDGRLTVPTYGQRRHTLVEALTEQSEVNDILGQIDDALRAIDAMTESAAYRLEPVIRSRLMLFGPMPLKQTLSEHRIVCLHRPFYIQARKCPQCREIMKSAETDGE